MEKMNETCFRKPTVADDMGRMVQVNLISINIHDTHILSKIVFKGETTEKRNLFV